MHMRKIVLAVILIALSMAFPVKADNLDSLNILNGFNFAKYFSNYLGGGYDSHGSLQFSPSDIYLLKNTIPKDAMLTIAEYGEVDLDKELNDLPILNSVVSSQEDVLSIAKTLQQGQVELVVYPTIGKLFIYLDGNPTYQVNTLAGFPEKYRQAFNVQKGKPISWDPILSSPTEPGDFKILISVDHYQNEINNDNTVVPFGSILNKVNGNWQFIDGDKIFLLPNSISKDLNLPVSQRKLNYFDVQLDVSGNATSAKWGGNDFGKYALLWTKDGKTTYPELGYCNGKLLFDQASLVEDMADILTGDGSDDFDRCISSNQNYLYYKAIYDFVESSGEVETTDLDPVECSYFRLFNNLKLSDGDTRNIDIRVLKAFNHYRDDDLPVFPWERSQKEKEIGLYNYVKDINTSFLKQAGWYKLLNNDWPFWSNLRTKFRGDFKKIKIFSPINRKAVVEKWLNDRLEFVAAVPPVVKKQSFSEFFSHDLATNSFAENEQKVLRGILKNISSDEVGDFHMDSVDALNEFNFGVLLNEMLGDLYKSHGCFHVSPRNAFLLNKLLPIGAKIAVKPYTEKADMQKYAGLPYLASMVNFLDDLGDLKKKFDPPNKVRMLVYPGSQIWIILINEKPFAQLQVEAGPQSQIKVMQGRDKNGSPIFEKVIAYPSPPGNYKVFKKLDNYVSTIYYDETIIPQGALITKVDNKWTFTDAKGRIKDAPQSIEDDLDLPVDQRQFTYYWRVKDKNGDVVSVRWGDNPFGQFPILISTDMHTPVPELIHTSGDLMMEQRTLVSELIKVLSAPQDSFEECIKYSKNFASYSACYDFVNNTSRQDLLQPIESGSYKLNLNLPLTSTETAAIPPDVFVAYKIFNNGVKLSKDDEALLVKENIARWENGVLKIDMAKVYGVIYDLSQYSVSINKNVDIYSTLKEHWAELSNLRTALFNDLNTFVINDQDVFSSFTEELIQKRANLQKLSQSDALKLLQKLQAEKGS